MYLRLVYFFTIHTKLIPRSTFITLIMSMLYLIIHFEWMCSYSNVFFVKAKILTGPPVPPTILMGWTTSLNPFGGNVVPFKATFSRLYKPALESMPCASKDRQLPGSMLGPSTPTPYTFPESAIHCAASLDNPGNLYKHVICRRVI